MNVGPADIIIIGPGFKPLKSRVLNEKSPASTRPVVTRNVTLSEPLTLLRESSFSGAELASDRI